MERYRGRIILLVLAIICVAAGWVTLRVTAAYPELGEEVSYEVNEVDGFKLTITPPVGRRFWDIPSFIVFPWIPLWRIS